MLLASKTLLKMLEEIGSGDAADNRCRLQGKMDEKAGQIRAWVCGNDHPMQHTTQSIPVPGKNSAHLRSAQVRIICTGT